MPNIPHPDYFTFGRIVMQGSNVNYQITARDACTLAVSVQTEDLYAPEYVLWCYIQRQAARLRSTGWPLWRTVMLHSQPINPSWAYPERRYQGLVRQLGGIMSVWNGKVRRIWERESSLPEREREHFHPSRIRRRRNGITKIQNLLSESREERDNAWQTGVPANIKLAVIAVLSGQVGNTCPGKTDFANLPSTAARRDATRLGGGTRRDGRRVLGNYFIVEPPLPGRVDIVSANGETSLNKRRNSFPITESRTLADFNIELGEAGAITESLPDEDLVAQSSTETQDDSVPPRNNITIVGNSVPDASQQTIQRYTVLDEQELRQSIDDWAAEIEDLLTTIEPV